VAEAPFKREAQKALAEDVTALVHGSAALDAAVAASQAIFGRGELAALSAATLTGVADSVPSADVASGTSFVDALVAVGLVESRSEARRAIAEGGAYLNNESVTDPDFVLTASAAIAGGWAVVRRGKKTVGLVRIGS
jgi:tyrosyl-tRNA synthetase